MLTNVHNIFFFFFFPVFNTREYLVSLWFSANDSFVSQCNYSSGYKHVFYASTIFNCVCVWGGGGWRGEARRGKGVDNITTVHMYICTSPTYELVSVHYLLKTLVYWIHIYTQIYNHKIYI